MIRATTAVTRGRHSAASTRTKTKPVPAQKWVAIPAEMPLVAQNQGSAPKEIESGARAAARFFDTESAHCTINGQAMRRVQVARVFQWACYPLKRTDRQSRQFPNPHPLNPRSQLRKIRTPNGKPRSMGYS